MSGIECCQGSSGENFLLFCHKQHNKAQFDRRHGGPRLRHKEPDQDSPTVRKAHQEAHEQRVHPGGCPPVPLPVLQPHQQGETPLAGAEQVPGPTSHISTPADPQTAGRASLIKARQCRPQRDQGPLSRPQ